VLVFFSGHIHDHSSPVTVDSRLYKSDMEGLRLNLAHEQSYKAKSLTALSEPVIKPLMNYSFLGVWAVWEFVYQFRAKGTTMLLARWKVCPCGLLWTRNCTVGAVQDKADQSVGHQRNSLSMHGRGHGIMLTKHATLQHWSRKNLDLAATRRY